MDTLRKKASLIGFSKRVPASKVSRREPDPTRAAFTMNVQSVPDSSTKIYSLVLDKLTKRFYLDNNIYVDAIDKLTFRVRSRMLDEINVINKICII